MGQGGINAAVGEINRPNTCAFGNDSVGQMLWPWAFSGFNDCLTICLVSWDHKREKGHRTMFGRILKKDLKRNKTMNIILFLFIIIASVFFASGLNNLIAIVNGTDYQFKTAEVGDYQLISMGEGAIGFSEEKVKSIPEIKKYTKEVVVFVAEGNIKLENGKRLDVTNAGIVESIDGRGMKYFDKDNNELTSVEKGKVLVSVNFMSDNNLEVGDKLIIEKGDVKGTYEIQGSLKDAFLGSKMFGNPRFFLCDEDFQKYLDDEVCYNYYGGEIFYIHTDNTKAVGSALSDLEKIGYSYPVSQIKMAYVMNLIVAFTVVILSVCLMIVSFLVLRFTINFSISDDFREIGVMKAIGIRNKKIRSLYLAKYAVISVVGSLVGLFVSIPFGKLLLDSVSGDMILGSELGIVWNVIGSVCVMAMVILLAYLLTGKVKKHTPIDAIRSGQTGERFKKKGGIRISRSKVRPSLFLAINDILSSPKRFVTVIITFSLCTLLVLVIVNTTNTMNSDKLLYLFGTEADVYVTDTADVMTYMNEKDSAALKEHVDEMAKEYTDAGMPCTGSVALIYTYEVVYEGESYSYAFEQDLNSTMDDFRFSEGVAPANKNEIAITEQFTEIAGANIGDSVMVDFGNGPEEMLITAKFQSMNDLGQIILLRNDVPTDFSHLKSIMQYKFTFTDDPSQKTIDERIQKMKDMSGNDKIMNAAEYCRDCVKVYDIMNAVAKLLLLIVMFVVILITVLMERSFISDEKNEIAITKAVGFKDSVVIRWHVFRFLIVAFISMIIAAGLSIPITNLTISPIFGMMGASEIDYKYDLLGSFMTYPTIVLATTVITAFITALYTKKIQCKDTASIE